MSTASVSSAISYARENQQRFLDELKDSAAHSERLHRPKITKTMYARRPRWSLPT